MSPCHRRNRTTETSIVYRCQAISAYKRAVSQMRVEMFRFFGVTVSVRSAAGKETRRRSNKEQQDCADITGGECVDTTGQNCRRLDFVLAPAGDGGALGLGSFAARTLALSVCSVEPGLAVETSCMSFGWPLLLPFFCFVLVSPPSDHRVHSFFKHLTAVSNALGASLH